MSAPTLQSRLKELSAALGQIHPLIDRLRDFTAFVGQGDQARLELGAEVHARLKGAEEEMELLRDEAEGLDTGAENRRKGLDSEKEAEKERVVSLAEKLAMDLKRLVLALHGAVLSDANVVTGREGTSEMHSYRRRRTRRLRSEKRGSFCCHEASRITRNDRRRS
jgi:hypothetical protein